MIERFSRHPELALGYASSIMGSYSPEQTLLDISAGARTWTSLYEGELPAGMELVRRGGRWSVRGWAAAVERARTPPADIVPGTLGEAAGTDGRKVVYAGLRARSNREAIVAAALDGSVDTARLTSPARLGGEAVRLWRRADLIVARLPAGGAGARALSTLLRSRRPGDVVIAVQLPTRHARRLLAVGVAGAGVGRDVRSSSTRLDGLVVSTDLAPTVLDRLGARVPKAVAGERIEASGDRSVADLMEIKDRLSEIGPRRWPIILAGLAGAMALAALATAFSRSGGVRQVLRAALLASVWIPPVLLLTGALAPSWAGELLLVAGISAVLALATDRLLPWPFAPALPAAVTVLAHVVDLAMGSELIVRSLLGPNPLLGARFYGVGNEMEVTLGVIALLGIGSALAVAPPPVLAWGFALGGGALAFALSWGRLGADVGASIMLGAGTAAAVVYALEKESLRWRVGLVVGAPALALGALAAVDLVTGGDAHFTRSVLRAGGLHEVGEVAQRRLELSYHSLKGGLTGVLVLAAVLGLVAAIRYRRRLLAPLAGAPGIRAALAGAVVAVVAGALSNDSGPIIFLIGAVYLGLFIGYSQSMPNPSPRIPLRALSRDFRC